MMMMMMMTTTTTMMHTINMKRMTCIQTAVNVIWSEDRV